MKKAGSVLVLLAIAIAVATFVRGGSEASVEVRIQKAEQRGVTSRVLAQGKIKAKTQVEVSSEVAGRVAAVNVEIGDVVKIGDVLFALDGEQMRSAVEQIGASLAPTSECVRPNVVWSATRNSRPKMYCPTTP